MDIFRPLLKALPYHNDGRALQQPEVVHCAMLDSDRLVPARVHAPTAELVGVESVAADCVEVSGALHFHRAVVAAGAFSLFGTHAKIRTWAN